VVHVHHVLGAGRRGASSGTPGIGPYPRISVEASTQRVQRSCWMATGKRDVVVKNRRNQLIEYPSLAIVVP
jgi:hypothetical protein